MLAYVFWHVPRAAAAAREYESAHRAFHEVIRTAGIPGLFGVRAYRIDAIPWLGGRPGFEDWHLLEDSSCLDPLDRAAVSGNRQQPHDRIAALAGSGTAGLYSLRAGSAIDPAVAYWMSKPEGMSYASFGESLAALVASGCALWGRRMTLGPTPEFCLHAPAAREMPFPAQAIELAPAGAWPA